MRVNIMIHVRDTATGKSKIKCSTLECNTTLEAVFAKIEKTNVMNTVIESAGFKGKDLCYRGTRPKASTKITKAPVSAAKPVSKALVKPAPKAAQVKPKLVPAKPKAKPTPLKPVRRNRD